MKKEDLLEAALKAYMKNPNATVNEVAREAGVSKSTIFYYFRSKTDLEKELLLYAVKKFSPWKDSGIEEAIRRRLRLSKENPEVSRMIYALFENIKRSDPEFISHVCLRSFEKLGEVLRREGFRDSTRVAILLRAMLDGLAMYSLYTDIDLTEFEDLILKVLRCLRDDP